MGQRRNNLVTIAGVGAFVSVDASLPINFTVEYSCPDELRSVTLRSTIRQTDANNCIEFSQVGL